MRLWLVTFSGFFLIVGLATFLTLQVFTQEVKPGVRQAMEDTLVDTAHLLAAFAADDLEQGHITDGAFARLMSRTDDGSPHASIWGVAKESYDYRVYITDNRGRVVYDSAGAALGADYSRWNDVRRTLQGRYGARSTLSDPQDTRSSVMHVAAPIQGRDGSRIGSLTVAKPNRVLQPFIDQSQQKILRAGGWLVGAAGLIGILCTLWLVRSLRRLRTYARKAAEGERTELSLKGGGELAELGRAIETMRVRLEDKQYVEQYVSTLTHELKSPLAAIQGAAELLEEPMGEPDRHRFLGNIRSQTERLRLLVQKLLALAEVEQRLSLKEVEPLLFRTLVEETLGALEPKALQRGVTLRLESESDADPREVEGDRLLLEQAIRNLIDNAIEFAPAGSSVVMKVRNDRGTVALDVLDEGPGIPDYARERIFERFYSLPRPGSEKGTGLGLCFVREVASLHRGLVTVENRREGGARASLSLPSRTLRTRFTFGR